MLWLVSNGKNIEKNKTIGFELVEEEVASLGAYKGGDYIDFDPNPVFSFLIIYIQQQIAPN